MRRTSSRLARAVSCASTIPSAIGRLAFRAGQGEQHRGQALADLVVQLLGDSQPLGLLRLERAARALAPFVLEAFDHLVEGGGELVGLRGRTAHRHPLTGIERVHGADHVSKLLQRTQGTLQQEQVDDQHGDETP